MYAELNVSLKSGVNPGNISTPLASHFGNSKIAPAVALAGTALANYANVAVGAASFPSGVVVVYLCTLNDQVSVYVFGKTIPQLKDQCANAVKQLRKIPSVKVAGVSASVLVPSDGTDIDILTGTEKSLFSSFWHALIDKAMSKLAAAAVNSALAVWVFSPTATASRSALIGLGATAVGVVLEAAHAAWRSESWGWTESR